MLQKSITIKLKSVGMIGVLCIYFTTKLLWDTTVPYIFELASIGIILYGAVCALFKDNMRTSLVLRFLAISVYIIVNAFCQDPGKVFIRAMYEYMFYFLIFFGTYYYGKKAKSECYFDMLLKIGVIVSALSWLEYFSHYYILPNTIEYIDYTGFRSIVFSRTFLAHGMVLTFFSLIGFYKYLIKKKVKYLAYGCLLFISIFSTGSRGPLVAAIGGLCVMLVAHEVILKKHSKRKILLFLVSLFVIALALFLMTSDFQVGNTTIDYFLNRFRSILDWKKDDGNTGRLVIWKNAIKIFKDHPIFGVGPSQTGSWNLDSIYGVTESGILKRLCEFGIVGFILFYSYVFDILFKGVKNYYKQTFDQEMIFYFGLFTSVFIDDITLQATEEVIVAFFMWYALAGIENSRNRLNIKKRQIILNGCNLKGELRR